MEARGVSGPTIGLATIATGRYIELLAPLLESARAHFFPGELVKTFVFTDSPHKTAIFTDAPQVADDVLRLPIEHEPWPLVALHTYHYFTRYAERFAGLDYLYFIDVDMRFVARCADEILPHSSGLVAVEHPDYWRGHRGFASRAIDAVTGGRWSARPLPHAALPFERDPRSTACVSDPHHRYYYAGAFAGGRVDAFLEMAHALRDAVEADHRNGVIAVWHDESHLNRYLYAHPPKRLAPAYCYPESVYSHLAHLEPVILALDKDHAYFRAEPHAG
jgi:histo-blood group ABO system transferase